MTTVTPEQRAIGRDNARSVLGTTRRRFLQAAAVAPIAGAYYFGYAGIKDPVRAAIIGTGNEGCQAMIRDSNPDFIKFIGYCDARPTQQRRAVEEIKNHKQYSAADAAEFERRRYESVEAMLADPDVEAVVVALPLWLHAPVSIMAMRAGKHVFCEKLMAHSIGECKAMCRAARAQNKILGIGHQRHYSTLYDNANYLVSEGHLGEIRHIRALWHRNNAIPRFPNNTPIYSASGEFDLQRDPQGNVLYHDSWKPDVPQDDANIDLAKWTLSFKNGRGREWRYRYRDVNHLVRWRLYNDTGAGLMAELGSHQLDACSIFLGKVHPLSVIGVGGTIFYEDGREVDDHVFVTFEFPMKDDPQGRGKDRVVVTYSSINTNRFENYGEMIYGTRGTMVVEGEKEILLWKEASPNDAKPGGGRSTSVVIDTSKGKPAMETSPSLGGASGPAAPGTATDDVVSRGYREELEHFAYCIRNNKESNVHEVKDAALLPRCSGEVALADAVVALVSNLSMAERRPIRFDPAWFDYSNDAVPDKSEGDLEMAD